MPSMLGKRKTRPTEKKGEEEEDAAAAAAREALRKHFEARFKPVAVSAPASCASKSKSRSNLYESGSEDEDDDYSDDGEEGDDNTISHESGDDDEWAGLSGAEGEDDDTPQVQVVDHTASSQPANILTMSKKELKAYLVCIFPPISIPSMSYPSKQGQISNLKFTVFPPTKHKQCGTDT